MPDSTEGDSRLAGVVGDGEVLLVVGRSSDDPDIAPFTGEARIGECFVLVCRGEVRLGYLSPIEREEAQATGLELLTPDDLEVSRASRGTKGRGEFWAWVLGRALLAAGVNPTRVALAGHPAIGWLDEALAAMRADGWSFVSGHDPLLRYRKRKTQAELADIRVAAQGVCAAFRGVAITLLSSVELEGELWSAEGRLTVGALRREVGQVMALHGLSQPEGSLIAPGGQGAVPHNTGRDDTVLRARESLIVDLFPRSRMYADCTRTFCVGEPAPELSTAWGEVKDALELAYRETSPGVRGWNVQEQVCQLFESRGYPTVLNQEGTLCGYVHGLAHGVGFEVHEYPEFRRESSDESGRVEEGDVLTLEPGLYDPDQGWAVRLEDLVHVSSTGLENLTPLPYEMDPHAWMTD